MSTSDVALRPTFRPRWRRHYTPWKVGLGVAAVSGIALVSTLTALGLLRPEAVLSTAVRAVHAVSGAEERPPAWEALRVAPAEAPGEHWSAPMPARVAVDERWASRVGAPVSGRVTRVFVELGQRVERGEPLFSLESPELVSLRSELARAEVAAQTARVEDQRVQSMVMERLTPAKEGLESSARLRRAELALSVARARQAALRAGEINGREIVVRAPQAGVVVDKQVLPSQNVSPSDHLLQLADLSHGVWVFADVLESDIAGIAEHGEARLRWQRGEDARELDVQIEHVSAVVDPTRHSVRVRMHAKAPELRPNQYAEVRFRRLIPASATEVAASALVSDGVTKAVYVVDARGRLERRNVVVGGMSDGRAWINAGLELGESVVQEGAFLLENGLRAVF